MTRPSTLTHVLAILLGVLYLMTGGFKLSGSEMMVGQFEHWGYPIWFMYLVGVYEVVTAFLLFRGSTRFYGAVAAMVVMLGAIFTHLKAGEITLAAAPLVLFVLAGFIAKAERSSEELQRPA